jgi:siroheme synthase-like protein
MAFIPVFLDAADLPVLVLGGDAKAQERVRVLLEAGARITLISPIISAALALLAANGRIRHEARSYTAGDLRGFSLVYCTIDDQQMRRVAAAEARALGVPINVSDDPLLCSFIVPAVVKRGGLQVAVSTGGASPALASLLREELSKVVGPEYESLVAILGAARQQLLQSGADSSHRAATARELIRELRDALMRDDGEIADQVVHRYLGISMSQLQLKLTPLEPKAP